MQQHASCMRKAVLYPLSHPPCSHTCCSASSQPATQLELWRHGYVFWCSDNVWRLCAHQHHPLPTFRRLMRPGQQHFLQGGPYVDAYLMWPSEPAAAAAVEAAAASFRTQAAAAAAAGLERPSMASDTQRQQQAAAATQQGPSRQGLLPAVARGFGLWGSSRRQREWQLCFSQVPVQLSGRRRVWVEGLQVVVPDNSEQLLAGGWLALGVRCRWSLWCCSASSVGHVAKPHVAWKYVSGAHAGFAPLLRTVAAGRSCCTVPCALITNVRCDVPLVAACRHVRSPLAHAQPAAICPQLR